MDGVDTCRVADDDGAGMDDEWFQSGDEEVDVGVGVGTAALLVVAVVVVVAVGGLLL